MNITSQAKLFLVHANLGVPTLRLVLLKWGLTQIYTDYGQWVLSSFLKTENRYRHAYIQTYKHTRTNVYIYIYYVYANSLISK